jgi:tight adherence protein C
MTIQLALVAIIIVFVLILAWLLYRGRIENREEKIREALPEVLDLLTVMIEAGMSLDGAMNEVAARSKNVLGEEFAQVMRDITAGGDRTEALNALARRCQNPDIDTLVEAIKQSELMGTSMVEVLRFQASDLRRLRRERAQRKAASARVKMLLPMVGCIFPVIWIVILGPALLILMHSLGSIHH